MSVKFLTRGSKNSGGGYRTICSLASKFSSFSIEGYGDSRLEGFFDLYVNRISLPIELKFTLRYLEFLFRYSIDEKPDILVSQFETSLFSAIHSQYNDVSHIVFVHDQDFLHNTGFKGSIIISKVFNLIFSKINTYIFRFILSRTDLVIANSHFIAEKYEEKYKDNFEVVLPFVEDSESEFKGEKILHINPAKTKGIEITLSIAEKLPEREFLVVGKTPVKEIEQRMQDLDNVEYRGYIQDIEDAYREAKLLLVPSTYNEPYGMVAVEAMSRGIPVLTSGKGGLSEAAELKDFIVPDNYVDSYLSSIEVILDNYNNYSDLARRTAEGKLAYSQYKIFKELLKERGIANKI